MRKSLIAGLAVAASLAFAATASAEPTWAPASSATVHPGVMTFTEGAQCTSNFVFYDASDNVYIGQAAHCSGTGGSTETDGCLAASLPNGTAVEVTGASQPGTMVYNSWNAMQAGGETDADTCAYNDFALIQLSAADAAQGQPVGADARRPDRPRQTTATLDDVYSYGNSSLRQGITVLSPKRGKSLGASGRRLDAPRLHRLARHPRRLRQRLHGRHGQRVRRPLARSRSPRSPRSNGVSDLRKALAYALATAART